MARLGENEALMVFRYYFVIITLRAQKTFIYRTNIYDENRNIRGETKINFIYFSLFLIINHACYFVATLWENVSLIFIIVSLHLYPFLSRLTDQPREKETIRDDKIKIFDEYCTVTMFFQNTFLRARQNAANCNLFLWLANCLRANVYVERRTRGIRSSLTFSL